MKRRWLLSLWLTLCMTGFVVAFAYGMSDVDVSKQETRHNSAPLNTQEPDQAVPTTKKITVELPPKPEPLDIVFAGDTLMDWSVRTAIEKNGPDYPFQHIKSVVQQADYAVLNLETSITTRADKVRYQLYTFKSDPIALQGIRNAGFKMVTLANNHVLDYKEAGFRDTLSHLQQHGLSYVGAGLNATEAYSAKTVTLKGQRIKFLAFSHFLPDVSWYADENRPGVASGYQQERVISIIEKEKLGADALIVYFHWGEERKNHPREWQRTYAKRMIDAGVDAVVGSHPHVLQGFEYYKGRPIAYSLGNFLFPDYVRGATAQTGLLNIHLEDGNVTYRFTPYLISNNQILPLSQAQQTQTLNYLQAISYGTKRVGATFVQAAEAVHAP